MARPPVTPIETSLLDGVEAVTTPSRVSSRWVEREGGLGCRPMSWSPRRWSRARAPPSRGAFPERVAFEVVPREGRRIEIEGRPIHYVDEGEGPPLLFVHAGTGSFPWRDVIVRLRERFRCVGLDVLGAGPPRVTEGEPLDLGALSRILGSFVRALDLSDITLVVHDLGGPVALGIARACTTGSERSSSPSRSAGLSREALRAARCLDSPAAGSAGSGPQARPTTTCARWTGRSERC